MHASQGSGEAVEKFELKNTLMEIPPHIAVSDFVRRVKGRSSHRVQMEFPDLRKRTWGRHFWARGYYSTTSGNITDDVILQYLQEHEPTGASR
jgi:putative transposase